ncbi:hypothetical protein FS749_014418 [Ceratobasidium sp. UAMH 11750]|nr:hypothetical protein FS749_014418 [Ceratobasidium sp. UAMH 11750]
MAPGILPANPKAKAKAIDIKDLPDEPGAEMAREARVWRTYVKETDKWDKEMVDGKNNSLDVLLIFAALFSAISTAFIVESLGDLKPDPAESSAQTLLIVSQTLAAIANNQPVTPSPADGLDTPSFSPSRSAVIVNILWILSLSLSVAVSLVAMLAKEWCYKFMSSRSGSAYEQARRRQKKWNGIERWKMMNVLTYLPGVMHIALLLFSAGLCLHLWDLNTPVAIPVIVVTGSAALVYICATVLPSLDPFCPYSTPAAAVFTDSMAICANTRRRGFLYALLLLEYVANKIPDPTGNASSTRLESLKDFVLFIYWVLCLLFVRIIIFFPLLVFRSRQIANSRGHDDSSDNYTTVPMDMITSQMLSWLIANCEDSRSVDIALQAITGADSDLPHEPLIESGILGYVLPRLDSYLKRGDNLPAARRYYQIYGEIMSGCAFRTVNDRWVGASGRAKDSTTDLDSIYSFHSRNTDRIKPALDLPAEYDLLASAATTTIPFCHWSQGHTLVGSQLDEAPRVMTSLIERQLRTNTDISAPVFSSLVRSTAHYLIGVWPREERPDSHSLLPVLLVNTFISYHGTAPSTARAAAIALVCATFASGSYPRGERPTRDVNAREERAVDVLRYYQAHKPNEDTTMALFMFGFYGLLPQLDFNGPEIRSTTLSYINGAMQCVPRFVPWSRSMVSIQTLPSSYSVWEQVYTPILQSFSSIASGKLPDDELRAAFTTLPLLFHQDAKLYVLALMALCQAKSHELQTLCLNIVDAQPIPDDLVVLFDSDDNGELLGQLCRTLIYTDTPALPIAALHFELLVASVVSNRNHPHERRKAALAPLLGLRNTFIGLNNPSLVSLDAIFAHPREGFTQRKSLLCTMQLVVDFCEAGLDQDSASTDWRDKLAELKESYKPGIAKIPHPDGANPGYPSLHVQEVASSSESEPVQVPGPTMGTSD